MWSSNTKATESNKVRNIHPNKLPPYGKRLLNKPKNRYEANRDLHIFIGKDCWNWAKIYQYRDLLVFPNDEVPDNFNWSAVVKNREVLLWLTSTVMHEQLRYLSYILLKSGALVVRAVSMIYWNIIAIYRKNKGGLCHEQHIAP